MPKDFVGMSARVAQAERRMCVMVAGSSRPERALKNEVFRLCETMAPEEMKEVLGKVYVRLGASERTASMAEYLKDLYGSGSRRMFVPRPIVGSKLKRNVKPVKVEDGWKLSFARGTHAASPNVAASIDFGKVTPSAVNSDNVVTLKNVANYCLHTAKLYTEVKPVYDMLLELYSNNPTKEWLGLKEKIRTHMDTLPKGGYTMIVNGDFVENKQVANHVEAPPAAPRRDGRARPTRKGKVVDAVYTYTYINQDEGKGKIGKLFQSLLELKWIDKETNPDVFFQLFSGEPETFHLKWIGAKSDLFALIKRLYDEKLILCPEGAGVWVIARSHFLDKQGVPCCNLNKQKMNKGTKKHIDILVEKMKP